MAGAVGIFKQALLSEPCFVAFGENLGRLGVGMGTVENLKAASWGRRRRERGAFVAGWLATGLLYLRGCFVLPTTPYVKVLVCWAEGNACTRLVWYPSPVSRNAPLVFGGV